MTVDTYTLTAQSPFIVPAGVTSLQIDLNGAGGSGGGYNVSACGAGGGAYCQRANKSVTPGDAITFTMGIGGTAVTSGLNGIAGTSSTCDGMTANGGAGGAASGGAGGTGSGGDTNTSGSSGQGWPGGNGAGAGGASPNGGAGGAQISSGNGNPGSSPGGGGSGGGNGGLSGAGAAGQIKFTYTASAVDIFPDDFDKQEDILERM